MNIFQKNMSMNMIQWANIYKEVGGPDEDYPYDRIKVR